LFVFYAKTVANTVFLSAPLEKNAKNTTRSKKVKIFQKVVVDCLSTFHQIFVNFSAIF